MTEQLRVSSQNPFQELTLKTRVRQLLHTHQGRDKLFKVLQYTLRLRLWWSGVDINTTYVDKPGNVTSMERNLMTTVNTRRLFRVGRFVGEFVRLHATLIKCSDLVYSDVAARGRLMSLFLQLQMVADIVARVLMLIKSVCEDVAYLAQKGFLHTNVAERLLHVSAKCALPVLAVDLALNTLRLAQGVVDAAAPTGVVNSQSSCASSRKATGKPLPRADRSFSLLTEYDTVDKIRRRSSTSTPPPQRSPSDAGLVLVPASTATSSRDELDVEEGTGMSTPPVVAQDRQMLNGSFLWDAAQQSSVEVEERWRGNDDSSVVVSSYPMLFWADFELHWMVVTQLKLVLDIFVAMSVLRQWQQWKGGVSVAGFLSGILSVYRVWTYGR